jgi:hypothetical protein
LAGWRDPASKLFMLPGDNTGQDVWNRVDQRCAFILSGRGMVSGLGRGTGLPARDCNMRNEPIWRVADAKRCLTWWLDTVVLRNEPNLRIRGFGFKKLRGERLRLGVCGLDVRRVSLDTERGPVSF